jgi:hypothetical protein
MSTGHGHAVVGWSDLNQDCTGLILTALVGTGTPTAGVTTTQHCAALRALRRTIAALRRALGVSREFQAGLHSLDVWRCVATAFAVPLRHLSVGLSTNITVDERVGAAPGFFWNVRHALLERVTDPAGGAMAGGAMAGTGRARAGGGRRRDDRRCSCCLVAPARPRVCAWQGAPATNETVCDTCCRSVTAFVKVTRTGAREAFDLRDHMLDTLPFIQVCNPYYPGTAPMCLVRLTDVKAVALAVHGTDDAAAIAARVRARHAERAERQIHKQARDRAVWAERLQWAKDEVGRRRRLQWRRRVGGGTAETGGALAESETRCSLENPFAVSLHAMLAAYPTTAKASIPPRLRQQVELLLTRSARLDDLRASFAAWQPPPAQPKDRLPCGAVALLQTAIEQCTLQCTCHDKSADDKPADDKPADDKPADVPCATCLRGVDWAAVVLTSRGAH